RRRAHETPEHRGERRCGDGQLPVHPAAGARPRAQIGGVELARTMFRGEVGHDLIRLPQHPGGIFQGGGQGGWVYGGVGRGSLFLPKYPPTSMRSCARSSSPTAHITFWTFTEVLRPQILIIAFRLRSVVTRVSRNLRPPERADRRAALPTFEQTSIQPARLFRQHDRNAGADGISKLGRARDQLLLLRIIFERPLCQWADQNFQELRIDAAGGTVGRGGDDILQDALALAIAQSGACQRGNWGGALPWERPVIGAAFRHPRFSWPARFRWLRPGSRHGS